MLADANNYDLQNAECQLLIPSSMGVRRNFSRGGKVDILLIFLWLLAMQRKLTYSLQKRKCPMLRQQLHTVFFCRKTL